MSDSVDARTHPREILDDGRRARAPGSEGSPSAADVDPDTVLHLLRTGRQREAHALVRTAFDPDARPTSVDLSTTCEGLRALASAGEALRSGRVEELVSEAGRAADRIPPSAPWLRFRCGSVFQACYRFTGDSLDRRRATEVIARAADRLDLPRLAVPARALLGNIHLLGGAFHATFDHCEAAIDLGVATGLDDTPVVAMAYQFRGYVLFEWNRLPEAEASLLKAWSAADPSGRGVRSGTARVLAEVCAARGDAHGAKEWLARLEKVVSDPMTLRNREWLSAVRMRRTLGTGDLEAIEAWLRAYDYRAAIITAMDPAGIRARLHEMAGVLDLLEATEQWDELRGVAEAVARCTVDVRPWFAARALSAAAVACESTGRSDDADRAQTRALAQGEVGSLVRAYLGRSRLRRMLLRRAASGPSGDHALRVLRALGEDTEDRTGPALTPRQATVLGRVALGESNKAIARALGVSVNTVRAHLRAVFERLGVSSRTEAVARARVEGLTIDHDPAG